MQPFPSNQPTTLADLVFVSFSGKVFAVHRLTGEPVWRWVAPKGGRSPVMVMPDLDRVIVCCQGYTWALDARTGQELWFQPFQGEGVGIPMLASMRQAGNSPVAAAAAAAQHAAAVAAAAAAAAAGAAAASG